MRIPTLPEKYRRLMTMDVGDILNVPIHWHDKDTTVEEVVMDWIENQIEKEKKHEQLHSAVVET